MCAAVRGRVLVCVCVCVGVLFLFSVLFFWQGHATIIKTCWKIYERRQRQRTNRTNRPTTSLTGPRRANEPRPRGHWGPCERQLSSSAGHVPVPLPVYPRSPTPPRAAALLHCAPIGNDKGVFIYVVPTAEKFSRCTCQKLLTVQWLLDLSSSRQLQPLCGSNTGHSCGPIKSERTHDQVDKSQLHYSAHSGMSSVTSTQICQTECLLIF